MRQRTDSGVSRRLSTRNYGVYERRIFYTWCNRLKPEMKKRRGPQNALKFTEGADRRTDGTSRICGFWQYKYNIKLLYAKTVVRVAVEVRQAM